MGFTATDVEKALCFIENLLGVEIDREVQARYESGREMYALSYDKLQRSTGLPALSRYIIAARSYLHQPCVYYDIFRACRATIYVQLLAAVLEHLSEANIDGVEPRLDRLRRTTDYDVFDSVLFELATAWRYSVEVLKSKVAFMAESADSKTPDFSYNLSGVVCYCECKKLNQPLAAYRSDTYALYPLPALHGEFVQPNGAPLNDRVPFSTWLSDIWWDAAIKWKISNEEIIAKYRRFAFDGVFQALAQVETQPINSTAHIWLESDYYLDGRENTLKDLFQRIQRNARDIFGWLMINETLLDVSPKGHFDVIEHSHIIEGPTAISAKPPVTLIITRRSTDSVHTSGEFGKGTSLPDIDA